MSPPLPFTSLKMTLLPARLPSLLVPLPLFLIKLPLPELLPLGSPSCRRSSLGWAVNALEMFAVILLLYLPLTLK